MKSALFNYLVCGYRSGHSQWSCFTRGYAIGMDTRRGRFVYWLLNLDDAICRGPSTLRFWLADQLARLAMRLRGEKVSVFAFYDCARGNRAAVLADRIFDRFISEYAARHMHDELWEARCAVEELSSLAGAAWHRNDQPPF